MATPDSKKVFSTASIDPNFSLPPGVIDLEYRNIDEPRDSSTERSEDNGEVINVDYDSSSFQELNDWGNDTGTGTDSSGDILYPPDSITLVTQTVRITSDGRTVVDVVLEIDNSVAGVTYDVRLTKP
jgi:hypothetical protein